MTYVKGKSGLTLPKQTGQMSQKRDISIKVVERWRRQLPLVDVGITAKEFFLMLQDSHQAPLTYQERYEILFLLRPILQHICQSLKRFYESQDVLDDELRSIADLVNALQIEMLNGYNLVIEDAIRHFFYNRKTLIAAIQNAMYFCSKLIFQAYEQHREISRGIWITLHTLYHIAKVKRVANKSLNKYLPWQCRFGTLADIYKHCLLVPLINPNHLRRSQFIQVLDAMENWAPKLVLCESNEQKTCLYAVEPALDSPPQYSGMQEPSRACYFLDLDKINERLLKLMDLHSKNDQKEMAKSFAPAEIALSRNYIESILTLWRDLKHRTANRLDVQRTLSICLGITACHWFLSTKPLLEDDALKLSLFDGELINQSEKGCSVKLLNSISAKLEAEEIVGLQLDPIKWAFGVIRWLKNNNDDSTIMGIEILSTQALAVKTRIEESSSPFIPTLLFAPQNQHKSARLVAPPLPFKVSDNVEIEYDNRLYIAKLKKCYTKTSSFHEFGVHFAFQQIEFQAP